MRRREVGGVLAGPARDLEHHAALRQPLGQHVGDGDGGADYTRTHGQAGGNRAEPGLGDRAQHDAARGGEQVPGMADAQRLELRVPDDEDIVDPDVRRVVADLRGRAVALLFTLALFAFMKWTHAGRVMRATAQDGEAATLMGINTDRVYRLAFAIGIALDTIYARRGGWLDAASAVTRSFIAWTCSIEPPSSAMRWG